MMLEPGCRAGSAISPSPPAGRCSSSAGRWRSSSGRGQGLERPLALRPRPGRLRFEVVAPSVKALPVCSREQRRDPPAELGMGVEAGADRGAADRQLAAAAGPLRSARHAVLDLRRPAAELLAEPIGVASIRCVRPVLTTASTPRAFVGDARRCAKAGSRARHVEQRRHVDRGRGSRRCCSGPCSRGRWDARASEATRSRGGRSPRWRSCWSWSRSGLEDVDREVRIVAAVSDLERRRSIASAIGASRSPSSRFA